MRLAYDWHEHTAGGGVAGGRGGMAVPGDTNGAGGVAARVREQAAVRVGAEMRERTRGAQRGRSNKVYGATRFGIF